jgi:phosphoribosylglycinamide formyltransferase-1
VVARLVVLASGSGTLLQALLDATADPHFGAHVVAVGSDRPAAPALDRARRARVDAFELAVEDFSSRAEWEAALTDAVARHEPDLVVLAGFMRLLGAAFLTRFGGRAVNSHPALLPSFPGMHAPRDALEYGVKVTGATLFLVDAGVDSGAVIEQVAVPVADDDDEVTLHERIKVAERAMLVDTVGRMAREGFTIDGRKVMIP